MKIQTALFAACATVLSLQPAQALVYTFDPLKSPATPSGGTGTWDTELTNNVWANAGTDFVWANAGGDTATFAGTAGIVTVGATPINVDAINFNVTGYTVSGGVINFTSATPTLTLASGVAATLNSTLIGSTGLVFAGGTGTLTINNAANALSGGIKLNSGTLTSSTTGSLGSNLITLNGGTYSPRANFSNDLLVTANSNISVAGTTGAFTLGNLSIGGGLNLFIVSDAASNGSVTFGTTTLTGSATITNAKAGSGSSYSSPQATFGAITVGDSVTTGTTTTLTLGASAGANRTRQFTLHGVLSDNATDATKVLALNISPGGTTSLTVNVDAANTYTGSTTINGASSNTTLRLTTGNDRLPVGTALIFGTGTSTTSQGTLDLNGFNQTVGSINSTGTGTQKGNVSNFAAGTGTATFTVNSATTASNFAGSINDGTTAKVAFVKAGVAAMTLSGPSGYTGGTIINGGTLTAGGSALAAGAGTGTWSSATNVITLTSVNGLVVGQKVSGTGIPAGTAITAINTSTNVITLSANTTAAGTSAAVNYAAYSALGSGPVTVNNSATLSVTGSLLASSPITVNSGGTLQGTGSIAGVTTLNTGSFVRAGINSTTVGTLTFSDTLTGSAGVTFSLKLDSQNNVSDLIAANGLSLTGATLNLTDLGTATLALGVSFTIFDNTSASSIAGTFAGLNQGDTFTVGANTFRISYQGGSGNDIVLTTSAIPEPSTYALLGGLLGLGAAFWRSRKRA